MVIKKGKHDIRSGGQVKNIYRYYRLLPSHHSSDDASRGYAFFVTSVPTENGETEGSLNKRKRWQLPEIMAEKLRATYFDDKTTSPNKAFVIVEFPGSYSDSHCSRSYFSYYDRTRLGFASRLIYFDSKYDKPVEVGGKGKLIDSLTVLKQLQNGTFHGKSDKSQSLPPTDDVDFMFFWHNRPSFLRKRMATLGMSQETYRLGTFPMTRDYPPHRRHLKNFNHQESNGEIDCETDEVEEDDGDCKAMSDPVPELRSVTLGDLLVNCDSRQRKKLLLP